MSPIRRRVAAYTLALGASLATLVFGLPVCRPSDPQGPKEAAKPEAKRKYRIDCDVELLQNLDGEIDRRFSYLHIQVSEHYQQGKFWSLGERQKDLAAGKKSGVIELLEFDRSDSSPREFPVKVVIKQCYLNRNGREERYKQDEAQATFHSQDDTQTIELFKGVARDRNGNSPNVVRVQVRLVPEVSITYPRDAVNQLAAVDAPSRSVRLGKMTHRMIPIDEPFEPQDPNPKDSDDGFVEDVINHKPLKTFNTSGLENRARPKPGSRVDYEFEVEEVALKYRSGHTYKIVGHSGRMAEVGPGRPLYRWTLEAARQVREAKGPRFATLLVEADSGTGVAGVYDLGAEGGPKLDDEPRSGELLSGSQEWFTADDLARNRDLRIFGEIRMGQAGHPLRYSLRLTTGPNGAVRLAFPRGDAEVLTTPSDKSPLMLSVEPLGRLVDLKWDTASGRATAVLHKTRPRVEVVRREGGEVKSLPGENVQLKGVQSGKDAPIATDESTTQVLKALARGESSRVVPAYHESLAAKAKVEDDRVVLDITDAQPLLVSFQLKSGEKGDRPAAGWTLELGGGKRSLDGQGAIRAPELASLIGADRRAKLVPPDRDSRFAPRQVDIPSIERFRGTPPEPISFAPEYARVELEPSRFERFCPGLILTLTDKGPSGTRRVALLARQAAWPGAKGATQPAWKEDPAGWIPLDGKPRSKIDFELAEIIAVEPLGLRSQAITFVDERNTRKLIEACESGDPGAWDAFFDDAAGVDVLLDDGAGARLAVRFGGEPARPLTPSPFSPKFLGRPLGPAELEQVGQGKAFLLRDGADLRKLKPSQHLRGDLLAAEPALPRPQVLHIVICQETRQFVDLKFLWEKLQVPLARSLSKQAEALASSNGFVTNVYVASFLQGEIRPDRIATLDVAPRAEPRAVFDKLKDKGPVASKVGRGRIDNIVEQVVHSLSGLPGTQTDDDRVLILLEGGSGQSVTETPVSPRNPGVVSALEQVIQVAGFDGIIKDVKTEDEYEVDLDRILGKLLNRGK